MLQAITWCLMPCIGCGKQSIGDVDVLEDVASNVVDLLVPYTSAEKVLRPGRGRMLGLAPYIGCSQCGAREVDRSF